jgi:hypothetical protein
MDDQTAIDVYERDKYSEDHREHRDGDGDAPKGSPIEHDATLTDRWERAVLFGRSRDTSGTSWANLSGGSCADGRAA